MQETDQMWASMASWFTPIILFCFLNFMIAIIFLASNFRTDHHHHPQEHSPGQLARAPSLLNRVKSINFPFYSPDHHYPFASQPYTQEPTSGFTSFSLFHEERNSTPSQLVRPPSLLERVKSITQFSFSSHESYYPAPPQPQMEQPSSGNTKFSESPEEEQQGSVSQLARAPSLLERVRSFNFSPYNQATCQTPTQIHDSQGDLSSDHHVARSKSDSGNHGAKPAKKAKGGKMKKSASAKGVKVKETDEDIYRRRPATVRGRKSNEEEEEKQGVDALADDFINKFKQQLKLQRLDSMLRFREMLGRGT